MLEATRTMHQIRDMFGGSLVLKGNLFKFKHVLQRPSKKSKLKTKGFEKEGTRASH